MTKNEPASKEELIDIFSAFIRAKGIEIEEGNVEGDNFFQGVTIRNGKLVLDRKKLPYPGDLLHEAGHIAVAPPDDRAMLGGNVTENRPGTEGEEMSVMLWTYAACAELNLPVETVFHADGYKGESQWIVEQYRNGNFIGLPLLVWMGLTKNPGEENGFPKMIKWIRE